LNVQSELTSASLSTARNQQLKSGKTEKKLKRDMLRSIGKQSWESMQSVRKRKKKATVGRICRKKVLSLE